MTLPRLVALLAVCAAVAPAPAHAVLPGANGRIAFDCDHGRTGPDIYTVRADGSHARHLTDSPASEDNPSWSPDGSRIAYIRAREIWVMRADGSRQHRITHAKLDLRDPAWSPDGKEILYATEGRREDLWAITPDGKHRRRVTRTRHAAEFEPAWSPTGARIAFAREGKGGYKIVTSDASGAAEYIPLATVHQVQLGPSFSPDGARIAYFDADGVSYVVGAGGTGRYRAAYGSSPAFSPDGALLALSIQDEEGEEGFVELRRPLGKHGRKVSPFPSREYCDNPDWKARG